MQSIPDRLEKAIKIVGNTKYASWSKETPSDWVDILLDDAIYWYGFIPRYVFQQVLLPVKPEHNASLPSNILGRIENLLANNKSGYGLSTSDAMSQEILALPNAS